MPLSAQFEITELCNYRCPHCYRLDQEEFLQPGMDDASILQVTNQLIDAGVLSIIITGGEPLVRKELVMMMVKNISDRNVHCSVNTNLALLKTGDANRMIEAGLNGMLVSCPGASPDVYRLMTNGGDLDKFLSNLQMLLKETDESSLSPTINMVVNKHNLSEVEKTAMLMIDYGIKTFGATPMTLNSDNPYFDALLSKSEVTSLIDTLVFLNQKYGLGVEVMEALPKCVFSQSARMSGMPFLKRQCQAGRTVIAVGPTGEVRPCAHNTVSYGNIMAQDLHEIWAKMTDWRNNGYIPTKCHQCEVVKECLGGCRINALASSGQLDGDDPWEIGATNATVEQEKEVMFAGEDKLVVPKYFRWREEDDGSYIVCGKSPRNATRVTRDLFFLIQEMRQYLPKTFNETRRILKGDLDEASFKNLMKGLLKKGLVNVQS